MTAEEFKTHPVVLRLVEIQKELGMRDIEFAKHLGFDLHGSNWGKILAGTYDGRLEKCLLNFEVCLDEYEHEGLGELEKGVVVLKHVREAIDAVSIANVAEDEHRAVIISGVRGSGKSRTLDLIHAKNVGYKTSARPSWAKSYLNFLNNLAATKGMELGDSSSAGKAESLLINYMKSAPRQTLCIGEFNYFNSDAIGFIKTVLNETTWSIFAETIPFHLSRMAASASTSQESAQFLRRCVAIIRIPAVTIQTVESLRRRLYPDLDLAGSYELISTTANQFARIDSICQILADCEPGNLRDVPKAVARHKRYHSANLKPGEE